MREWPLRKLNKQSQRSPVATSTSTSFRRKTNSLQIPMTRTLMILENNIVSYQILKKMTWELRCKRHPITTIRNIKTGRRSMMSNRSQRLNQKRSMMMALPTPRLRNLKAIANQVRKTRKRRKTTKRIRRKTIKAKEKVKNEYDCSIFTYF